VPDWDVRQKVIARKWRSILVAVFLVASIGEFSVRGPIRLLRSGMGWNDFLSPYIQAKAWAHGQDPYSTRSLISFWPSGNRRPAWVDSDAASGELEKKRGIPSPYPLPSLVILAPFTALSWLPALSLWIGISIAAVVLAGFALLSISDCRLADQRSQLFIGALLALAPLHTGIGTANPAILAGSLTVGTHWAARAGKEKTAGILLAVAVCLKPTVAGGLLLFYLIRCRWKVTVVTCAVAATVGILGVSRLTIAGVSWLPTYVENTRKIFALGSVDDFSQSDQLRFNMINAQVLFAAFLKNASAANVIALLLGATLLGCWLWLCYRSGRQCAVLEISAISMLSLLAVYHRFYDAVLLIWPLAWSLLLTNKRLRAAMILVTIAPFLLPGPVLLSELSLAGRIPPSITNGWWWNRIVMPHEVWILIVLTTLLLYFMRQELSEQSQVPSRDSVLPSIVNGAAL